MLFNATFNTISAISWRIVLLVDETRRPGENHRPVASQVQALSHNAVHLVLIDIRTHRSVAIGINCIGELGAIKPKGLAKIGYNHLCLREENLSFDKNDIS